MKKLSLDALKMRAEAVASEELLATISGGTENACHDTQTTVNPKDFQTIQPVDNTGVSGPGKPVYQGS